MNKVPALPGRPPTRRTVPPDRRPRLSWDEPTPEYSAEYSAEKNVLTSVVTDPTVAMVADIFGPVVQVVSSGPAGPWPPQGSWIPSSVRTFDVYGTAAPTRPCPCCGSPAWHRAGSGWSCSTCHPDPRAPRVDELWTSALTERAGCRGTA